MEFCKNCGAMLLPNTEVCNNCGEPVTSEEIDKIKEEYVQELDDRELNSKETVVNKGDEISNFSTINKPCPECGQHSVITELTRIKGIAESETFIFKCLKCGNAWRDN